MTVNEEVSALTSQLHHMLRELACIVALNGPTSRLAAP